MDHFALWEDELTEYNPYLSTVPPAPARQHSIVDYSNDDLAALRELYGNPDDEDREWTT